MALKTVLNALSEAPEALQGEYVEQKVGDKTVFVLDLDGIDDHPKVRGVITANRANVAKRDEYKAKVTELEERLSVLPEDFDLDEYTQLKAGKSGTKPDEALQALRDQHARAIQALKDKHTTDLAAKDKDIGERDGYIDRSLIDGGLKDALLDAGINPDLLDGALASLRGNVKVQRADNGDRKAIIETDLGEVGISDFVKDWAGSKGKAYLGKPTGPDPRGNNGHRIGAKTITRADFEKLDGAAKHKALLTDKMTVVD
ncbi:conserved hypothetical protein [Hyphomicrobiales bacterium]|nr:conserved hypothetical protein [Hyphomicrobiales bacterium]CAH1664094.1 conserved hypothetical protein [Hyphomicrobiales bacterium]